MVETAGNPLASTEALSSLQDDQLAASVPNTGPIGPRIAGGRGAVPDGVRAAVELHGDQDPYELGRILLARAELRATGETTTTNPAGPTLSLTPQELHVALAVAGGATNKEAAAALFISAKTVEFNLGNIYQKLGLRSRTELTRRMSEASNGSPQGATGT